MKLTPTITAAALAFAASASAADCTPGLDYCSSVLTWIDSSNSDAIEQLLQDSGQGFLSTAPGLWETLIFHCNSDHSLTWRKCEGGTICASNGAGQNDTCEYLY